MNFFAQRRGGAEERRNQKAKGKEQKSKMGFKKLGFPSIFAF
jgi:hypothetical protein